MVNKTKFYEGSVNKLYEFLEEKWINDGCRIEVPDYEIEDRERLEDALCALDRTLDNFIKNRK